MTSAVSETVRCMGRHESKGGKAPAAVKSCLACQKHFCAQCDAGAHPAGTNHHRFVIAGMRSHIDFSTPIKAGESNIRRSNLAIGGPKSMTHQKCTTLYESFARSVRLWPDRPCMGVRQMSGGKIGGYRFQTYKEVAARANNVASGLRALGVQPKDRVGLYSVNRPEWVIAEQGCFMQNLLTTPLYDTLGPDAAEQVIQGAGVSVVFASMDKVATLAGIHDRGHCPNFKVAVIMPLQPFDKSAEFPKTNSKLKIMTFADLEKLGASKPVAHTPPAPTDLATLCYTSGTTGAPKGAMLTHENIVSDFAAAQEAGIQTHPTDSHVSFLPLAHMFERIVQACVLGNGGAIGFSRGDPLLLLEDIEELKPTIFAGVPRLYNRLYDRILAAVGQGGAVKKWLFEKAYTTKKNNLVANGVFTHAIWDRLVFGKVAARLGGRVRLMITGSAPIGNDVMKFLRVAFSCAVVEGYGQTEGTAAATLTAVGDQKGCGNVGAPISCCEVKLVDVPDMNYTSKDVVDGIPAPRGEIWVKGSSVFKGYYQDPERTKESLDDEGWLHSGDIGMWLPDGNLKIIDRKKNIFKLAQGEYIAPEKIENFYLLSKYVAQVFVYGDSLQSSLVGVVVPNEDNLREWAKLNRITVSGQGLAPLLQNPAVMPLIFNDMAAVAKANKLAGFEQVKAIHLSPELFSVQNNILTPTFKLKRDFARKVFEKEIAAMYQQINSVEKEKKQTNIRSAL